MIHPLQYEPSRPIRRMVNVRLLLALLVAAALGCFWELAINSLVSADLHMPSPSRLSSAALAGLAGGVATIAMRSKECPNNLLLRTLITAYLGIVVYWLGIYLLILAYHRVVSGTFGTVGECLWLFDEMGVLVLVSWLVTTLPGGLVLIPACALSCWLVWRTYRGPVET